MTSPNPPISQIGAYQLSRLIGSGNSASVYLASDGISEVAIKVRLRREGHQERFLSTRFLEGARLQKMFCHPNIVWLYDAVEERDYQALILEYVQGGSLSDLCKSRGGKLSRYETCALGMYVADALDHVHDIGIVHRDVKPDNLIFGRQGAMESVKLADFDVSKHPLLSPNITENGSHVGTLFYMSPEQFDQAKPKPSADVYSLGIVLYEVMTGQLPFESKSPQAAILRFLDQTPLIPLTHLTPHAGQALEWVIERAAETNPVRRIPNAATLATLLMALEPSLFNYERAHLLLRRTHCTWIQNHLKTASVHVKSELTEQLTRVGVLT